MKIFRQPARGGKKRVETSLGRKTERKHCFYWVRKREELENEDFEDQGLKQAT